MARFSVYRESFAAAKNGYSTIDIPAETVSVSITNEVGIASQYCLTENHQYTGLLQS